MLSGVADPAPTLLEELDAEGDSLDAVVELLNLDGWDLPTPSPGWRIRDQIGHLAFFDERGRMAAHDPDAFIAERDAALADFDAFERLAGRMGNEYSGLLLLSAWRTARGSCLDALALLPDGVRLPWYGPPMSLRSFVTARMMETWAHGQDVVDALRDAGAEVERPPTDRLRHICHLGFATRGWSYTVRGQEPPSTPVRVELVLPSGASWSAGDEAAGDSVTGSAEDFCLVVTQRRNVANTALDVVGPAATEWMSIAQAFAGGATLPPAPRG